MARGTRTTEGPAQQSVTSGNAGRAGGRGTRLARRWRELEPVLLPVGTLGVLLLAWELAARLGLISTFFFSSPTHIVAAGGENLVRADFWNDVWVSTQEFTVGYVVGVALAVPFGLLAGWFRTLRYLFDPWLAAFNSLPRLALLPLVVLWVGLGFWSKAVIVFLGVFFSVAINTFHGVRTVDRNLYDVGVSFGASGYRRFISIVAPSAIPFALVGMKLGIGRAVSGMVIAEFFTSQAGLGHFVFEAGAQLDTAKILFGAIFITLLAFFGFAAISVVERRVKSWQPGVSST